MRKDNPLYDEVGVCVAVFLHFGGGSVISGRVFFPCPPSQSQIQTPSFWAALSKRVFRCVLLQHPSVGIVFRSVRREMDGIPDRPPGNVCACVCACAKEHLFFKATGGIQATDAFCSVSHRRVLVWE